MQQDFLLGDVRTLYRKLCPAVIMSMLTATVTSLVDILILSMFLGSDMISAVSVCMPIYMLLNALALLISGGAATVYAFFIGQGNKAESNRYYSVALTVTLLTGAALTLWGIADTSGIVRFLGANEAIFDITQQYAGVLMWFVIPLMLYGMMLFFVRYDAEPNLVVAGTLVCGGSNIVMDLLFLGPFSWGPWGAALATCLAYTLGLLVMLSHFLKKKNTLFFSLSSLAISRIWRSLKAGFPLSLAQFGMAATTMVFNIVIIRMGGEGLVAAYAVVTQVSLIALAFYEGVAQAGQPILSASFGAGNLGRTREVLRVGFRYEAVVTLLCLAACMFGAPLIAGAFSITEEPLLSTTLYAIRAYSLAVPMTGINVLILYYFQSQERTIYSTAIAMLHSTVFMILGLLLLVSLFGKAGIWWAWLLAEAVTLIVSIPLLRHSIKKEENN